MKNLFKKISALVLAAIMVLSMCTAVFADTKKVEIKLTGFASANKVEFMQIIQKDETKTSGWVFANGAGTCFKEALGLDASADEQQIIWGLIQYNDSSVKLPTGVTAKTVTAANIDLALSKVAALTGFTEATDKTKIEVSAAGIYAIKAEETGFTYKTATAYVGFGEPYPELENAEVTAKKSPTSVDKTVADDDHVVAIGDIVTYTIEAYVPFIDAAKSTNREFKITDIINGADYYLEGEGAVSEVKMNDSAVANVQFELNKDKTGFSINLDSLVADTTNPNAGNKITVTYTAKVNNTTVENTAGSHTADAIYGGENVPVKLFTGEIEILKTDDNKEEEKKKHLKDAGFKVYKKDEEKTLYAKFDANKKFDGWTDKIDEATEIKTGTDGKVKVEGLDLGTYWFKEVTAPEGYSLNTNDVYVTLALNANNSSEMVVNGSTVSVANKTITTDTAKMTDTRLNALPSTGGMGTYLFTIVGVVLMTCAAGAFFVSRRKANK